MMGFGAGYAVMGIGGLVLRSEEERLADLWKKDPATGQRPQAAVRIRPINVSLAATLVIMTAISFMG